MSSHGPPQNKHGAGGSGSPNQRAAPPPQLRKSKGLRADFLLDFQRPPSNQRQQQYAPPPRRSRPHWSGRQSAPVAFAKGRFVQSSFRLFVDEITPDVVEAAFNADALLQWENVRRVDLMGEQLPKCPICLEEEMAVPKITRCGHIYCFPCIVRYFRIHRESNGKKSQKCPVCVELTSLDDLTSARFDAKTALRENDKISFVLAQRDFSSTVVRFSPAAQAGAAGSSETVGACAEEREGNTLHLPREGDSGWHLSRLVQFAAGEFSRLVEDELEALRLFRTICVSDGESELLPSVDESITLLRQQYELHRSDENQSREASAVILEDEDDTLQGVDEPQSPSRAVAAASPPHLARSSEPPLPESPESGAASSPPLNHSTSPLVSAAASPAPESSSYGRRISFYQVSDGRLVFFEPFFSKILLHEHGGRWDRLPATLDEVRVERLHETTVSEDTRRRHKFLSHLPLGSLVSFAEVDLRNYLSRETKELFAEDFAKRRQHRKKDQQRELKQERISKERAAEEEERYYRELGRSHPSSITFQLPPTKEDFAVDLHGRTGENSEAQPSEGADVEQNADQEESGPTLADKLKQKMTKQVRPKDRPKAAPAFSVDGAGAFPELGGGAASSSGPSAWGRGKGASLAKKDAGGPLGASQASAAAEPAGPPPDNWDSEEEPSFGVALEAALRTAGASSGPTAQADGVTSDRAGAADALEEDPPDAAGQNATASGGKKKKGRASKATTIRLFG